MPTHFQAIATLTPDDLPGALALVRECGWNQVEADWALFLEKGAAFKVATVDGEVAATAAILPYQPFGWISMVLVGMAHRRQGLATELLQLGVAELRERGLVPMLDATPAGRAVYRQLGFRDGWPITRWRRAAASSPFVPGEPSAVTVTPLTESDWTAMARMDAEVFGADRVALLRALADRSQGFACVARRQDRLAGYLLGRDGRMATQLGPLVAGDHDTACALFDHALARVQGAALLDVLDRHAAFAALLPAAGFAIERGYTRMALGPDGDFGDPRRMVAIAGPELG